MWNNSDAENRKKPQQKPPGILQDAWKWVIFNIWKDLDAIIYNKIGKVHPVSMS